MRDARDAPGIHVPPPVILAAGFLVGYGIHWLAPISFYPERLNPIAEVSGIVILIAGLLLSFWGFFTFVRARTGVLPGHAVKRLVTHGPYRLSRNPMYTGMCLIYLGVCLLLNLLWPVLLLPLSMWGLWKLVIEKEEAFLEDKYGSEYEAFRERTRRWL
ncbi:MAG: isoprenylcysteine carboxylmethyltransferase family protein [Rubricoccaceae bacterium]|nr:isoprenylcysteine carboxylmethyltransferase family protein [Rubricoccaceae bacterium]